MGTELGVEEKYAVLCIIMIFFWQKRKE